MRESQMLRYESADLSLLLSFGLELKMRAKFGLRFVLFLPATFGYLVRITLNRGNLSKTPLEREILLTEARSNNVCELHNSHR